ncbi:MAG: SEL1-like repeat protein [Haemophilus parainfluenzae]|nr:SEL1-like repeat protein [Haemophilus parainfluenzae]
MNNHLKKFFSFIKKYYKCIIASLILLPILFVYIASNFLSKEQHMKIGAFLGDEFDKFNLIWDDCSKIPLNQFKNYTIGLYRGDKKGAYQKTLDLYKSGDIDYIRTNLFSLLLHPNMYCRLEGTQLISEHQYNMEKIIDEILPEQLLIKDHFDRVKNYWASDDNRFNDTDIMADLIIYYNYFKNQNVSKLIDEALEYCKSGNYCKHLGYSIAECFTNNDYETLNYCSNYNILNLESTYNLYNYLNKTYPNEPIFEYILTLYKIVKNASNKNATFLNNLLKTGEMKALAEKGNGYAVALFGFPGYSYQELKNFYELYRRHSEDSFLFTLNLILAKLATKTGSDVDPEFQKYAIQIWCSDKSSYFCLEKLGNIYFEKANYSEARKYYEELTSTYRPEALSTPIFRLGLIYQEGAEVRQNNQKALEYFGMACDNGHQKACYKYKEVNEKLSTNNN